MQEELESMMGARLWTYEETQMAFALYFLIPTEDIDKKNGDVWRLAEALGRTPRAAAMKLWNISAYDERRIELGKAGLKNGSALDERMWELFRQQGEAFVWEGVGRLDSMLPRNGLSEPVLAALESLHNGSQERSLMRHTLDEAYFVDCVFHNYENSCCLTGLKESKLLSATRIKPRSACEDVSEQIDPMNGLLLNSFHSRAFSEGLITLRKDLRIIVSPSASHDDIGRRWLWDFNGRRINAPVLSKPKQSYIEYHNDLVFISSN